MKPSKELKLKANEILVLRDVRADMTSHGGFVWPKAGKVTCPDWVDNAACGNGLHGLPWGCGGSYWHDEPSIWLVVRVCTDAGGYRHGAGDMIDTCKFKTGTVVYCGDRPGAIALLTKHAPANSPIVYSMMEAGDWSTQTAGDESTQKAGYWSTQKAGHESTQTAGNWSTQTAGDASTQTAGNWSTQKAGDGSTQTIRYFDGKEWRVKVRIITKSEADKWYRFENGDWRLATPAEVAEAERQIGGGK